jgi:hypothetical protein
VPTAECLLSTSSEPQVPNVPINLKRGDDVVVVLHYTVKNPRGNFDWTGWTFTAEARSTAGALWATATVTHDGTGGTVTILFPTADTSLLTPGAVGKWDLQGVDPGLLVRTVAEGSATVTGDVTV